MWVTAGSGSMGCSSSEGTATLQRDSGDTGTSNRDADLLADGRPSDSSSSGDASHDTAADASDLPETGAEEGSPVTRWWTPDTEDLPWQWEIDHEIVTSSAADMGTGDTTYSGAAALAPVVYDIDGFDNTAADVSALHGLGKKVICYIEVGAAENYRSDYGQFQAADLGTVEQGYADEKYININSPAVLAIIEARIMMCAKKGFDGIEPDIDDSYTDSTGFTITEANEVAYLTTLSDYAHALGVAWGLKNGGDGGDPKTFVPDMIPHVDFAVVEEPFYLDTIGYFHPILYDAGKAMFVAEYTNDTSSSSSFCPAAVADHVNAALFDVDLDGMVRDPCQ